MPLPPRKPLAEARPDGHFDSEKSIPPVGLNSASTKETLWCSIDGYAYSPRGVVARRNSDDLSLPAPQRLCSPSSLDSRWRISIDRINTSQSTYSPKKAQLSMARSQSWNNLATLRTSSERRPSLERVASIKDSQLLRGVPVHTFMGGFGAIFKENQEPVDHDKMSKVVPALQDFISHNWCVDRKVKWCTLALHYNFPAAILVSWLTGAIVAALTIARWLPLLALPLEYENSQGAKVSGHLAFFFTFAFWQDIKRFLPSVCRGVVRMAFVDKACIHQTDKQLMLEGIRSLAGFLRASKHMVVVYSPTYLKKLWTVYELASFMTLHQDSSRVLIFPTAWSLPVCSMMIVVPTLDGLIRLAEVLTLDKSIFIFATMAYAPTAFAFFIRHSERNLASIAESIRNFSIRQAHCSVEADRSIIQSNISTFMRDLGRVADHVPDEEALDAFDEMVQKDLHKSVFYSFIKAKFPVLLAVAAANTYVLDGMDLFIAQFLSGFWLHGTANLLLSFLPLVMPVVINEFVTMPLLSRKLHLCGWRDVLYTACVAACATVPCSTVVVVTGVYLVALTTPGSPDAHWAFPGLVAYLSLWLLAAGWTSRRQSCFVRKEAESTEVTPRNRAGFYVSV